MSTVQICKRCIMDDLADPTISFDRDGICNYCNDAGSRMETCYFPNAEGEKKLSQLISFLKEQGKNKDFDCLMGISGGVDSSYLAYLGAVKWGLRILAVHVDDGFNTPQAVENINNLCQKANIDLKVIKPDAEQFCALTRAFILAGVPNIAIPQDNVLTAILYKQASKYKINHFLSGANFSLESILQRGNTHNAMDTVHIKAINRRFGNRSIKNLPLIGIWDKYVFQNYVKGVKTYRPLNYIDYNLENALQELADFSGYRYYGAKHCESYLTKFMQWHYLPVKFNVDKRKSHLSSLIVSGQMSREEALAAMEKTMYDQDELQKDLQLIADKLGFSPAELTELVKAPGHAHSEYAQSYWIRFSALARKVRFLFGE